MTTNPDLMLNELHQKLLQDTTTEKLHQHLITDSAISALAELLLDLTQHEPCEPGCIRCGNEPSHTADDGQLYCELCRGCYVERGF